MERFLAVRAGRERGTENEARRGETDVKLQVKQEETANSINNSLFFTESIIFMALLRRIFKFKCNISAFFHSFRFEVARIRIHGE